VGVLLLMFVSNPARAYTIADLLDAMQTVETGGCSDPAHAVGDSGRSHGWLQISKAYYDDVKAEIPDIPTYEKAVADLGWSKRIVYAYWHRYAREALQSNDWETLARIHNGGPHGARKGSTKAYWRRVRLELAKK